MLRAAVDAVIDTVNILDGRAVGERAESIRQRVKDAQAVGVQHLTVAEDQVAHLDDFVEREAVLVLG